MALMRCRECGGDVSSEAAACPHCGVQNPTGAVAAERDRVARPDHTATPHRVERVPAGRRVRGGWRTTALLLFLVLIALFALWYSNIVNFT